MVFQCTGCDTYTLQAMGIVKSKISDKGNAEVKFGIPTGPNSNSSLGGDDASSHISFQSAQKGSETSATTSFYETAHDTTGTSAPRIVSHYTQSESSEESHELEKSIILINLDNTLEPPANEHATVTELITNDNKNMHGSEKLSSSASPDDFLGVIELSDDESDETGGNLNKSVFIKEEKEQQQKEIAIEPIARNAESMLRNYHNKSYIDFEESFENDKENRSLFNESNEKSLHFNDTMEEVEYLHDEKRYPVYASR
ncbi:uncharacterized protein [Eurosta solidaginis]|uniref:uncharacterized protein n=1 Tax=Eurosta solidaginis TaxID=178769 RepID=UPI0035308C39